MKAVACILSASEAEEGCCKWWCDRWRMYMCNCVVDSTYCSCSCVETGG